MVASEIDPFVLGHQYCCELACTGKLSLWVGCGHAAVIEVAHDLEAGSFNSHAAVHAHMYARAGTSGGPFATTTRSTTTIGTKLHLLFIS